MFYKKYVKHFFNRSHLRSILLVVLMIGAVVWSRRRSSSRRSSWTCRSRRRHTWPGGSTWLSRSSAGSWTTRPSTGSGAGLGGPGGHASPAWHASHGRRHTSSVLSVLLVGHGHLDGFAAQAHLSSHAAQGVLLLLLIAKSNKSISFAESGLIKHNLNKGFVSSPITENSFPKCTLAHLTVPYLCVKYLYNAKSSTSGVKSPTQIEVSI